MRPWNSALAALAISIGAWAASGSAQAAVLIEIQEVGSDVVATTSGTIDLTGLTYIGEGITTAYITPGASAFSATVALGGPAGGGLDYYTTPIGPASFGTGFPTFAPLWFGDAFVIAGGSVLGVPLGYTSGVSLFASTIFFGESFASLEATPGTYVFTIPADTITIQIGPSVVPEPATWAMMLVGIFGVGAVMRHSRRKQNMSASRA